MGCGVARRRRIGRCTKHLTINHLDAAVLTQGDSDFGDQAKVAAKIMSGEVATFDELVDSAPEWLQHTWSGHHPDACDSVVFLLGWSDRAAAFTAHAFASEQAFKPLAVTRPWVMPSPWSLRPSGLELRRLKAWHHDHPQIDQAAAAWATRPSLAAPESVEAWVDLAELCREQRALGGRFGHVFVAGDVFHTRLGRGEVHTQRVHQFNDAGDELLQMVAGTYHPLALAAACDCGTGRSFGECCGVVDTPPLSEARRVAPVGGPVTPS